MRILKIFLAALPLVAFGNWQAQTEDEALFLRRIADFWEEGEYLVAKAQIEEFLTYYPSSAFGDTLRAALADLLLREKNYSEALTRYTQISLPELKKKSFLNRMQCLYHLGWYATLADECEQLLIEEPDREAGQKLQTTYFLAIALYQQCLNSAKDPAALTSLAHRAEPYFKTLFESELSTEVAAAFAHLCCILKDFPKAAKITLDQAELAQNNRELSEELLFQAALIQAEYDKDLAIQTFSQIADRGGAKEKDASYNCLVLSFDAGRFDELVSHRDEFLKKVPEERSYLAHLFLGRSFLALKQYPNAVEELKTYLSSAPEEASEFLRGALLSLFEAAFHSDDLSSYELAFRKFTELFPSDPEFSSAQFTYAQALKKNGQLQKAQEILEEWLITFPDSSQKPQIFFELIQIEYAAKNWKSCSEQATQFLHSFGSRNELSPYAWRYLISSLMEMGQKEKLIDQLKELLKQETIFTPSERGDWQFLLAKTYFELSHHAKASSILEPLLQSDLPFAHAPNAKLLLAYCYRDGEKDSVRFCELAEEAIKMGANIIEPGALHAALFNAYLERNGMEKAEEHLFAAFLAHAPIEEQNLLWLSERLQDKQPKQAAQILDHLLTSCEEDLLFTETLVSKRAKIHLLQQENEAAVNMLEKLMVQYADSSEKWACKEENKLLLAQNLSRLGQRERAISLLDEILVSVPTLRTETAATACLERARERISSWRERKGDLADPEIQKASIELKNLTLQRILAHEPTHLEAALDYIALKRELEQPDNQAAKELALLKKTKADFENGPDLLSKDYHESLSRLPHKKPIFEGYMQLIEAKILSKMADLQQADARNQLRAKAKELLLQIINDGVHPSLLARARLQLEDLDEIDVPPQTSKT